MTTFPFQFSSRKIPMEIGDVAFCEIGHGAPVVLFHGGVGSWTHWKKNIASIAETRRVLAFDLPGYGKSAAPWGPADGHDYCNLVARCLDLLPVEDQAVDLVGFSFGGAVAARVAALRPSRVRSLFLVGPGGFGPPKGRVLDLVKVPPRGGDDNAVIAAAVRHNLLTMMLNRSETADTEAIALHLENLRQTRFDSRVVSQEGGLIEALQSLSIPINISWGAKDPLAEPHGLTYRIQTVLDGVPGVNVTIIPGAGHWAMYEEPELFNVLLQSFLKDVDRRLSIESGPCHGSPKKSLQVSGDT